MKIFTGIDICEIERIKETFDKYGEKFLKRTFTENEIRYCLSSPKNTAQRLAVRFAVKESVSKALGVGINKLGWNKGINWKDVEVARDFNGAIKIILFNKAAEFEKKLEITDWSVSVSHSKTDAIASAIGYKN
ncbi:MAG TPA: holo-ACP synthase [Candidatus Gastranaerophilales bacterium]|nr:holo-ACP synthase [Candidatus Gastranaerophilales bacterium]